jgi:hypothetical protein
MMEIFYSAFGINIDIDEILHAELLHQTIQDILAVELHASPLRYLELKYGYPESVVRRLVSQNPCTSWCGPLEKFANICFEKMIAYSWSSNFACIIGKGCAEFPLILF